MQAQAKNIGQKFSARVRPEDVIVHTPLAKADAILVLGNRMKGASMALAHRAAGLYHKGFSDRILVSGGAINDEGKIEADHIRLCLRVLGVPAKSIKTERRSTNTKENIALSRIITSRVPGFPKRPILIVIGQRFASRRILMTMAAQWPDAKTMLAPVCMMGKEPERWHEHPWAMHTVRREVEKLPDYHAKGDIAPIDINKHNRLLSIYKARRMHPRPIQP